MLQGQNHDVLRPGKELQKRDLSKKLIEMRRQSLLQQVNRAEQWNRIVNNLVMKVVSDDQFVLESASSIKAVHLSTDHRFGSHFFRFLGVHRCCLQTVNI